MISRLQRALRETTSLIAPSMLATPAALATGVIAGVLLFQPGQAQAQQIWNGTGSDFNIDANWTSGTVPGPGNVAVFSGSTANNILSTSLNTSLAGITYNAGASAYALTLGDNLQLTGSIVNNSGSNQVINIVGAGLFFQGASATGDNVTYNTSTGGSIMFRATSVGGLSRFNVGAGSRIAMFDSANAVALGSLSGSGAVSNNAPGASTFSIGGLNETSTFAGTIFEAGGSGALSIDKVGSGGLILSGENTYTGSTTVSAGALTVANASGLGAISGGTTVASGATLALSGGITVGAEALTLSGTGLGGAGALTSVNSGVNTFEGAITLAASSSINVQNTSSLNLSGGITGANTDLTLGGSSNNGGRILGVIAIGSGSITKSGSLWTLGGANTYSGLTTVNSGSLLVTNDLGLGSTASGTVVASGASLGLGSGINIAGEALTLSGTGAGGFGALLSSGSASSYGGAVTLAADSQINAGFLSILGTLTVSGGITGSGQNLTLAGPGTGTISGAIATGTGGLTKIDDGTWSLAGANTYSGLTTVSLGSLVVTNNLGLGSTASGTVVASGASLALGGGVDIVGEALTLSGTGAGGFGALLASGSASSYGGDITLAADSQINAGFLTTSGTLTVSGDITGSGQNLTLAGPGTGAVSRAIATGTGGLTKIGAGTWSLTGANTYTGATQVNGGTLLVNGSIAGAATVAAGATLGGSGTIGGAVTVASGGTLSAGNSPGTLTVASLALNAGSNTVFELGTSGVVGGATNDHIIVNGIGAAGNLTLGGTLTATAASAGYYRLFDVTGGGTISGSFSSLALTASSVAGATGTVYNAPSGVPSQVNLAVVGAGQTLQFWDGADQIGNGTVNGGAGTWNSGNTNWTGAPGQAGINAQWQGSVGVFQGTAGTVTVSGTQSFDTLQFNTHGYALTGGSLRLGVAGGGTINTAADVVASINSAIIDGVGTSLTKVGAGTLTLSGTNSYSGGTQLNAGGLAVGSASALGSGTLQMAGSTTLYANATSLTLANAVSLSSGTATVNTGAMDLGLASVISGTGTLLKTGTGVLTLSGANTYSGATWIQQGTLRMGGAGVLPNQTTVGVLAGAVFDLNGIAQTVGSLWGTGNVLLGGTTLTTGGDDSSSTFSGRISDAGSLVKTGTGTMTLDGSSLYTGVTQVLGGSLVVDGWIASSSGVTVAPGATLGGSGSVPVTVINGGTLSPGNSPGTLKVYGDLTFNPGSTYLAEVQGAVADRVTVTGTASLAGTLRLVPLGGAYNFSAPYTLLTAAGGLGGTSFGTVDTTGSFGDGITTGIAYTGNDVLLTLTPKPLAPIVDPVVPPVVTPTPTPSLGVGRPANAYAVASAIDAAVAGGADPSALFGIYNLPAAAIPAAVNSLSGEVHTAAPAMAHVASDQFLRTMLDPTAAGRLSGAPGGPGGAAGFTAGLPSQQDGPGRTSFDPARFTLWGASFGSTGRNDGDRAVGSANRNLSDAHVAVGADIRLGSNTVAGVAVAGGQSRASLSGGLGKAEADVFQAGFYGRTTLGIVNIAGALGYARLDTDTNRAIPALGRTGVVASYATQAWSGRIEASLRVAGWGGLTLSPLAAFQVVRASSPATVERDGVGATAGMLTLPRRSDMTSRSEIGLQLDANLMAGASPVTAFVRAAWAHYYQRDADLTASLNGLPGASFAVSGARPDRNAALLTAGADIRLSQSVSLGMRLDSELSGNTQRVGGTAQLRVNF